ncbi:MAG: type II toxin-antitoxin system RelE/ParE family toxin [Nitrospira sp.]
MADYSIAFARSARRELEALDSSVISRILSKIESLAAHPRPHGSRKLAGEKYLWRIRIGDYRVIYSILDKERHIDIAAVRHRREAYD